MRVLIGRVVVAVVVAVATTGCGLLGSDSDGNRAAFCTSAEDIERFRETFADFDPLDVPDALSTFRQAREEEAALRELAPSAIRADLDTIIAYLDDLIEGLETVDPASNGRPPVYDEVRTRSAEIEAASARVEQYVKTNC